MVEFLTVVYLTVVCLTFVFLTFASSFADKRLKFDRRCFSNTPEIVTNDLCYKVQGVVSGHAGTSIGPPPASKKTDVDAAIGQAVYLLKLLELPPELPSELPRELPRTALMS